MTRACQVEIAFDDADHFPVGETLTVEAAWRSGLDASAQWRVEAVEHCKRAGEMTTIVTLKRISK